MGLWTFWVPAAVITVMVMGVIAIAFVRPPEDHGDTVEQGGKGDAGGRPASGDEKRELRIYADQLREVESELQRGLVSEEEAERLRTEVARRLLEADRFERNAAKETPRPMRLVGLVLVPVTVAAAALVYAIAGAPGLPDMPLAQRHAEAAQMRAERPRQAQLEADWEVDPMRSDPAEVDPELLALIERLREALESRPDDLQGHQLLARNEAQIGNHAAAAAAQMRVIEIRGDDATIADHMLLAEAMIFAAGGVVSPEAERVLEGILRRDPANQSARYYSGLMFAQTGRPDLAFRIWRVLLEDSNPNAPWVPHLRGVLEDLAAVAGVRYTLPPAEAMGARGPSPDDMEAAMEMDPEDREAMIGSMVEGLAARLANQGGTAADWARLITSLGVIGQEDRARDIWSEARMVFADRPDDLRLVDEAARGLGVIEPD